MNKYANKYMKIVRIFSHTTKIHPSMHKNTQTQTVRKRMKQSACKTP